MKLFKTLPLSILAALSLSLVLPVGAHSPSTPNSNTPIDSAQETRFLSNIRQLTLSGKRAGEGYFGADGQKMIFQSEREAGNPFYQMYVLDFQAGQIQRISPGFGKTTCGWLHPNGKQALFASTHGDPASKVLQQAEIEFRNSGKERRYSWDYDENYEIYQSQLDGSGLKNLTQTLGYDAEGAYSPDGKQIVFASNRQAYSQKLSPEDQKHFDVDKSYFMEIYLMNSDGSNLRRLTHTAGYDGGPFFSADGKKITWRRFSPDGHRAEIYTMNSDGSGQKQLTQMGAMSWAPFFHPSGDYLIFATNKHGFGNFELYLVDAEGKSEPVRVTHRDGFDGLPSFTPDGKKLAWTSNRSANGSSQIFFADWNDAQARELLKLKSKSKTFSSPAPAPGIAQDTRPEIQAGDLKKHVLALTSDLMEGRLTGTAGEKYATEYLAQYFKKLGLKPAGDRGSYFQTFEFTAGASIEPESQLLEKTGDKTKSLQLNQDWRPLAFSQTGQVAATPVVFAGYGIVAPEEGPQSAYDAYFHLDVKDKWVMVLRDLPQDVSTETRQHLSRYASLRYKAMVAREKGAKGLIVVSGPRSQVKNQLVPFAFDAASGATSLYALSVSDALAAQWFAMAGKNLAAIQASLDQGKAVQGFDFSLSLAAEIKIRQEKKQGRNVLALLDQGKPLTLAIGAHLDHLGRGEGNNSLARAEEKGQIHHGADDNASGVAGVLELAEALIQHTKTAKTVPQQNILFALWSGEELGLLGSNHYVNQWPKNTLKKRISAYLNLDMVGRLEKALVLQGTGSSSIWPSVIEEANLALGLPLTLQSSSYLPTDATSFYLQGIPILSAFTGAHSDYHSPRDTAEKLNYLGLEKIVKFLERIVLAQIQHASAPDYIESEKPKETQSRGLRIYLGTIPDYASADLKGLKLSGVSKGGPAELAGLQAGDIIIQLGSKTIENIYDFTYAIDSLKIGEATDVIVERNGKKLHLKITPASRQ